MQGGAIDADRLVFSAQRCSFTNNSAFNGGALFISDSTITLTASKLAANAATNAGGGIYSSFSTLLLQNSRLVFGGLALTFGVFSALCVMSASLDHIFVSRIFLSNFISPDTQDNNTALTPAAGTGGGVYCLGQRSLVFSGGTIFTGNQAAMSGGAVAAIFCTPELYNTTVIGNRANQGGGVAVGLQVHISIF